MIMRKLKYKLCDGNKTWAFSSKANFFQWQPPHWVQSGFCFVLFCDGAQNYQIAPAEVAYKATSAGGEWVFDI